MEQDNIFCLLDKAGNAVDISQFFRDPIVLNFVPYVHSVYTEKQLDVLDDFDNSQLRILTITTDPEYTSASFDCFFDKEGRLSEYYGCRGELGLCKRAFVVINGEDVNLIDTASFDRMGEEIFMHINPNHNQRKSEVIDGSI